MSNYEVMKQQVRDEAVAWQLDLSNHNYSWGDLAYWCDYFERKGKRYGLLKEFRENGIC